MASDPKQLTSTKAGEKSKHRMDFGTTPGDNKPKPAAKPTAAVQSTAPPPAAGFKIKDEVEMTRGLKKADQTKLDYKPKLTSAVQMTPPAPDFKNAHGEPVKSNSERVPPVFPTNMDYKQLQEELERTKRENWQLKMDKVDWNLEKAEMQTLLDFYRGETGRLSKLLHAPKVSAATLTPKSPTRPIVSSSILSVKGAVPPPKPQILTRRQKEAIRLPSIPITSKTRTLYRLMTPLMLTKEKQEVHNWINGEIEEDWFRAEFGVTYKHMCDKMARNTKVDDHNIEVWFKAKKKPVKILRSDISASKRNHDHWKRGIDKKTEARLETFLACFLCPLCCLNETHLAREIGWIITGIGGCPRVRKSDDTSKGSTQMEEEAQSEMSMDYEVNDHDKAFRIDLTVY